MNNTNDELILVNCFYYSFYIKKSELQKFNIDSEKLKLDTDKIINKIQTKNNYYKIQFITYLIKYFTTFTI